MCTLCGCGNPDHGTEGGGSLHPAPAAEGGRSGRGHGAPPAGLTHAQMHALGLPHGHDGQDLHFGHGPAGLSVPGVTQGRLVEIETAILSRNDALAAENRAMLAGRGILAVNLVSSPGSGKTSLLVRTIGELAPIPVAVIEGDQQTSNDAERIRAAGAPAVQVNTGKGCHLDAAMVGRALGRLALQPASILFIENVGNLVCPAAFDLGEEAKVAVLSVTEGEDKPLKYPDIFAAARLAVINKIDLAPHCGADPDLIEANLRRVNPLIEVIRVSARTGEGMEAWVGWLKGRLVAAAMARAAT